ncbi:MAG: sigma-70 family RNA polymerase sigma factor [bacterium]|nr:sigma-70 family RNA polymerase sigma factor [bacterium]
MRFKLSLNLQEKTNTAVSQSDTNNLVEHFFRKEYGKILAVISRYVNLDLAEDIVQDTLMKATEHWKLYGIPPNPEGWLYTTAKNQMFNFLRKEKIKNRFLETSVDVNSNEINFSDEQISDEVLRVMLKCCHKSLSDDITITLILKILCGFSISEIASAYLTNTETINKRLVRGRKRLKLDLQDSINFTDLNQNLEILLKVIYLLFNEGYHPTKKDQIVRKDLCLEAIRLATIIVANRNVKKMGNVHSLLALMYLNCSRFEARINEEQDIIEIEFQDRSLWNKDLINIGLYHLGQAQKNQHVSKYLILASISGNHCISKSYYETNWEEILSLYDSLLSIEDSTVVRLNRVVALSKARSATEAIEEIEKLDELKENHLYYSVLAQLKKEIGEIIEAVSCYQQAIEFAQNSRDIKFLTKKMNELVPISKSQV